MRLRRALVPFAQAAGPACPGQPHATALGPTDLRWPPCCRLDDTGFIVNDVQVEGSIMLAGVAL